MGVSLFLVPVTGLEPVRCRQRWILSPLRLPFHHTGRCIFSLQSPTTAGGFRCGRLTAADVAVVCGALRKLCLAKQARFPQTAALAAPSLLPPQAALGLAFRPQVCRSITPAVTRVLYTMFSKIASKKCQLTYFAGKFASGSDRVWRRCRFGPAAAGGCRIR